MHFLLLSLVSLPPPILPLVLWPSLAIPLVALDTSDGGLDQPEQALSLANLGHLKDSIFYGTRYVCPVDFATSESLQGTDKRRLACVVASRERSKDGQPCLAYSISPMP